MTLHAGDIIVLKPRARVRYLVTRTYVDGEIRTVRYDSDLGQLAANWKQGDPLPNDRLMQAAEERWWGHHIANALVVGRVQP